jgi:hypothetical protein
MWLRHKVRIVSNQYAQHLGMIANVTIKIAGWGYVILGVSTRIITVHWDRWGDIGDVAGARLLPIVCGRVHGNISISVVVVVVVVVVVTLGAAAAINCIRTGPSGSWKPTATAHGASSMIALRTICVVAKIGNIDIVVTRLTDRDLRLHLLRGWMDCEVHLNQASEMAFGVRPGLKQEGVTVLGPYWD